MSKLAIKNRVHLSAALVGLVGAMVLLLSIGASKASAVDLIESFDGAVSSSDGSAYTQAGGHPYSASSVIKFIEGSFNEPVEDSKHIVVDLPPGFIGNPEAVPKCSLQQFADTLACPANTQVGISRTTGFFFNESPSPVFSLEPPQGIPAQFAFNFAGSPVYLRATLDAERHYALTIAVRNLPQTIPIVRSSLEFWGVPADSSHDSFRGDSDSGTPCVVETEFGNPCSNRFDQAHLPLVTNPTSCTPEGVGVPTDLTVESWFGSTDSASFVSHLPPPDEAIQQGPDNCALVPFRPTLDAEPTVTRADAPTGLDVALEVPQGGLTSPAGIATSHLKGVEVVLPEGMGVNPSAADGLVGCSLSQIRLGSNAPAVCPDASKIGTMEVETPLLEEALPGSIYMAEQGTNPFNSLLAIYLVLESEARGITIKLAGKVALNPDSGQLTAVFDDNPQVPFSSMLLRFKGGARAPLVTPKACGTYSTTARMTPWSATDPQQPSAAETVTSVSSFRIDQGPDGGPCLGGFSPSVEVGSVNPFAGSYSPVVVNASRPDGSAVIKQLEVMLPEGLTGKLAGVDYCSDASLASAATKDGGAELATPSCPASSRIGSVDVTAGAGPSPYRTGGVAYLSGPYKGAPLSVAVVTPAVAGPFDLGTVVVRVALQIDPTTARITAASDPVPHILEGVPLAVRGIAVDVDREQFAKNPTSCEVQTIAANLLGHPGGMASLTNRFQVAGCRALDFEPKLTMSFSGAPNRRGGFPALKAVLTAGKGEANIGKAAVILPKTELLEQSHIRTICTRVQWAANACPKGAIYGHAKAWTPLLDQPLEGPVYLRANGGERELPDLVADLKGQIDIELAGYIDTVQKKGSDIARIRTRFVSVPDAPVSRFVLNMQGGSKGLLANNTNLCKAKPRAEVKFDGHNGKAHDINPLVKLSCGKKGK
jgi:hypothetical protein